jgi:hypothetical protein
MKNIWCAASTASHILDDRGRGDKPLLLDSFFIVTSLRYTEKLCHEALAHYREPGAVQSATPTGIASRLTEKHWRK